MAELKIAIQIDRRRSSIDNKKLVNFLAMYLYFSNQSKCSTHTLNPTGTQIHLFKSVCYYVLTLITKM